MDVEPNMNNLDDDDENEIDNVVSSVLNSQSHMTLWLYQKW
jgi:hypothetical protein